jgi:hypothetical protein
MACPKFTKQNGQQVLFVTFKSAARLACVAGRLVATSIPNVATQAKKKATVFAKSRKQLT